MLTVRHSKTDDIEQIIEVYNVARSFMRNTGNNTQWINGYPNKSLIEADIKENCSYVVCDDDKVVGTFYFKICEDPTYKVIHNGHWLNDKEYGVIHRIGSNGTCHGVLDTAVRFAFEHIQNVRIDTHEDNKVMQYLLKKAGFSHCGIIYIEDGTPRLAFHKEIIEKN